MSSWPELCARYQSLSASLAKLGGLLGTGQLADDLLDELDQVVHAIAACRAENRRQVAHKLEIVLATIDATTHPVVTALIRSAVDDLHLVLHVA